MEQLPGSANSCNSFSLSSAFGPQFSCILWRAVPKIYSTIAKCLKIHIVKRQRLYMLLAKFIRSKSLATRGSSWSEVQQEFRIQVIFFSQEGNPQVWCPRDKGPTPFGYNTVDNNVTYSVPLLLRHTYRDRLFLSIYSIFLPFSDPAGVVLQGISGRDQRDPMVVSGYTYR